MEEASDDQETAVADKSVEPATPPISEQESKAPASATAAIEIRLKQERWVTTIRPVGDISLTTRWREPEIEKLLTTPKARRPDVTASLACADPIVAANAAIIVAAWRSGEPIEQLKTAVQNVDLALPLRLASIEALGKLDTPAARAAIEEMLDEYGQFSTAEQKKSYVPDLHAELICAHSRHAQIAEDARIISAMKSPAVPVRLEAAAAWARNTSPAGDRTPDTLCDLATDTNVFVRIAAVKAVALNKHPHSFEVLDRATRDYEVAVRLAAIETLGQLGTDEARQTLEKMRKEPSEVLRAAVIAALGVAGAHESVLIAAADRSWRVRQAVAGSLQQLKSDAADFKQTSQALAKQLVKDTSAEVQHRAVDSLREWPLAEAGPALLVAMADGTYVTRKLAAEQLGERWSPAQNFVCDAPDSRRAEQLAALQSAWQAEFGTLKDAVVKTAAAEVIQAAGLSSDQMVLLEQLLVQLTDPSLSAKVKQQVVGTLKGFGPSLIGTLETWTAEDLKRLPPEIYPQVLAEINPCFAAMERLSNTDPKRRRQAATELAGQLDGGRLSDLALDRLAHWVESETDPIIWQIVLTIIGGEPRPEATRLAYIAVGNASAEVRRRACEYLEKNPGLQHQSVLLPMLGDGNASVVIAAVRAIGAMGSLDDPQPLVNLLIVPDKQLRLEAAIALAKLKARDGVAAIERLSRETDLDIRRASAVAMGELADPVFLPPLILLLDDRHDIQLAAMASLAKISGLDLAHEEPGMTPDEQIRRWKKWYAERAEAAR